MILSWKCTKNIPNKKTTVLVHVRQNHGGGRCGSCSEKTSGKCESSERTKLSSKKDDSTWWFFVIKKIRLKKNASIIKLLTNWLLTFYNSWHGILWVFGEANETADAEEWGNGEKPASRVQMPSQRLLHNTWTLPSLLQPLRTLASHPVVLYFFWAVWYKKRNFDFFFLYFELKILLIFVWWWTARIHTPWKICI